MYIKIRPIFSYPVTHECRSRSGRSGNCPTNISKKITNNQNLVILSIVAIKRPAQPGTTYPKLPDQSKVASFTPVTYLYLI